MGLIRTELEVANWSDIHLSKKGIIPKEKIRKMNVKFLVDSGASMMAINEDVVAQLGLEKVDSRLAEMANGETIHLDVVGPLDCALALDVAAWMPWYFLETQNAYLAQSPCKTWT
jgi:gag-polyprotein putative aspartyl protease